MTLVRPSSKLFALAALIAVFAAGCTSTQKRMGGHPSQVATPAPAMPKPRLSATASKAKPATNRTVAAATTNGAKLSVPPLKSAPPVTNVAKPVTAPAVTNALPADTALDVRAYKLRSGDSVV